LIAEARELTEEEDHSWEEETYQIIRCRGCDALSFRSLWTAAGYCDENGDQMFSISLYPSRDAERKAIDGLFWIPDNVRRIYREVLDAMNASFRLLAAVGLRTLIEAICVDQKANGRNLENRIDALADLGALSKTQAAMLHSHRFLGNLAAHEISAPEAAELVAALEIAETVIKILYVIPKLRERITTGRKSAGEDDL
jgi:Domain of unknown function (DUF4145)